MLTCTLVSFFHGSNDGQKGMGLIMLILVGLVPGAFALNMASDSTRLQSAATELRQLVHDRVDEAKTAADPRTYIREYPLIALGLVFGAGIAVANVQNPQGLEKSGDSEYVSSANSGLIEYADSDAYDSELRASHKEGIDKVGQEVGTPVIAVPGADGEQIAFFGPVVTPAPKGEEAAQLWDGTLMVAAIPGFYEIKRTRTQGPIFD